MKNILLGIVVSLFIGTSALASSVQSSKPVQDTAAAVKYFQDELNFTSNPGGVKKVTQGKADGVIVDLRKKEHFDKGHIPGAINLPFDKYDGFQGKHTEFPGLSKDKINYVYCYELLCNLSQKAAMKIASLGYPVKEMKGGIKAWRDHDYPIEK